MNNNSTFRSGDAPHSQKFLRSKWLIWVLLAGLIGSAAYFYFARGAEQTGQPANSQQALQRTPGAPGARRSANGGERPAPVPVVAAAARQGDISVYLNGLGTASALNTVTVKARVDGQLTKVLFREGQVVKQGDLLAQIDPRQYQVQLRQAEGQMAHDQALLANARLDLERYRTLFNQDSIAKQQVDTQEALVHQLEGSAKIDQGQIDNANLQLSYTRIGAPINGRLGLRQVDAGNMVHANDTNGLVVITQLQPVSVLFTIPEDNIPTIMKQLRAGGALAVDGLMGVRVM